VENIYKTDFFGEIEINVMNRAGYKAIIIVPLRTQERHEAFLVINWEDYQIFPQPLRVMIELLAPRLAENITARRAYLQAQESQRETELFYRLSQNINSAVTYTQILDAFANVFGSFSYTTALMVAENYDFATATNAKIVGVLGPGKKTSQALDSIEKLDVIFLDLELPNYDGVEILTHLKSKPQLAGVPIVAYTVHNSEIDAARKVGFHSFLGKPLSMKKFPDQLQKILAGTPV